ncbi:MAG: ParA family protein [Leptolyngbya sp. SIO4C1]|nr:ParA family protein [Leptolyngbya sp. SIO4C1]
MGKTFALFNMSGGVGKSTLTQNLGYHLATDHDLKVLLIDVDPQASLTTFMGYPPLEYEQTIADSLLDASSPLALESRTEWCNLAPANIFLSQCEIELHSKIQRELCLRRVLDKVKDEYDAVLVDCPPSLGQLSINCISGVDFLIIPIQTECKSLEATLTLLQTTHEITQQVNPDLRVLGVAPTMYNKQYRQHQEAMDTIQSVFQELRANELFAHTSIYDPIPRSTHFGDASKAHQPLAVFKPKHPALEQLRAIADNMISQIKVPVGAAANG